jgi:hypothetical protein
MKYGVLQKEVMGNSNDLRYRPSLQAIQRCCSICTQNYLFRQAVDDVLGTVRHTKQSKAITKTTRPDCTAITHLES